MGNCVGTEDTPNVLRKEHSIYISSPLLFSSHLICSLYFIKMCNYFSEFSIALHVGLIMWIEAATKDWRDGGVETIYKEIPQINTASNYTYKAIDFDEYPDGRILDAPNLRVFSFTELRNATRNFSPDTILGEGGFGRVYKGWVDERTLSPAKAGFGMAVAVKKLNPESMQGLEEWKVK